MNEKFMSPFQVPGPTAGDMMKMIDSFLDYTLPLLVRSAKGSSRSLRGGSVGSVGSETTVGSPKHPVVEVTSNIC